MKIQKKKDYIKKPERNKRAPIVRKSVLDVLEVYDYDEQNDCYILKDGTYMNIVHIVTKDLVYASDDEVEFDVLKFAKMYRVYVDDLKIIAINFPCNTTKQQEYLEYKLSHTTNQEFKETLQRKLEELRWLGKHNTTREYYLMYFGSTANEIRNNAIVLHNNLSGGLTNLLEEIDKKKKDEILYRINNKCILSN